MNKKILFVIPMIILMCGCNNENTSSVSDSTSPTSSDTSSSTSEDISTNTSTNDDSSSEEILKRYSVSTCNLEETFKAGTQLDVSDNISEQNKANVDKFVKYLNENFETKDFVKTLSTSKCQFGYYKDENHSALQLGSGKKDGSIEMEFNYPIKGIELSVINYSKAPYTIDKNSEFEIGASLDSLEKYDLKTESEIVTKTVDIKFDSPTSKIFMQANGYSTYGSAGRVNIEYFVFYY